MTFIDKNDNILFHFRISFKIKWAKVIATLNSCSIQIEFREWCESWPFCPIKYRGRTIKSHMA
jgi:hypothetical protein